jgi:hypothetical protein
MSLPSLQARRRNVRPVVEGLESRELLNATSMVAAQVSTISGQQMSQDSIVGQLATAPVTTASTVPTTGTANGDLNPYGVAFVPSGFQGGLLHPNDVLVSNFNNKKNVQGTGTSIVLIHNGQQSVFFTSRLPGLDTGLAVLNNGFVIVGNVPTKDGTFGNIKQGSLQILNSSGKLVMTITDSKFLAEPWDLTVYQKGNDVHVFVSNLSKTEGPTGTVTRLDLTVSSNGIHVDHMVQIASGYPVQHNDLAVVLGPTGLALDPTNNGTLYVASAADNTIYKVTNAFGTGTSGTPMPTGEPIFSGETNHLNGPLGLVLAPNGDLITTNGDAFNPSSSLVPRSELVEFTPGGTFVAEFSIEPIVAGSAFGIALSSSDGQLFVAAVDDNTNSVDVFTLTS